MALFHGDLGFNGKKPCSSSVFHLPVADYLNTTKESLLMKMAWEMMNPEYKKGMQRKPTSVKKKDPISKTTAPPSKKASATTSLSNAESEKKKRLGAYINLDVLDKLFDDENSPKQSSKEECLLEPEGSEEDAPEEDKPVWNNDYSTEEANREEDEFYGGADLEYENQDEAEYNEYIIR
ncbi:PREDICTED: uncharacterized protein LOC106331108 [Brassica oleracea var. oleracea]|uniref:uncharacterized protein LOC106331108 n=1 Tax=Brassica oleracea var. oleracea TaxID=109376 RepID=UPI0006A6EA4D|nr:PREDICTED: uncharacterized protein LOC106331108 [Brassica oleracea var. oleracea]